MENIETNKEEIEKHKIYLNDNVCWNMINKYFQEQPYALVKHQLDSYNDFMENSIKQIMMENNPIKLRKNYNDKQENYDIEINIYLGGKNGEKIYFGSKPVIYNDKNSHYMSPNEARLRNMTYATSIFYDVDIEFIRNNINEVDEEGNPLPSTRKTNFLIENRILGRIPIMLHSNKCILNGLPPDIAFQMGECKEDKGGYFIIDGKEKLILPQEKFADNMMYIKDNTKDETSDYLYSCVMRTVSDNVSKPERTMKIHFVRPNDKYTNLNILVDVPNVRKPIPLFILMRALGVLSDKQIIETIVLDIDKYKDLIDVFRPCVHDAGTIFTQEEALYYMAQLTKRKSISSIHDILMNYFLPHIGEDNYLTKAFYLGYMSFELVQVYKKMKSPTDRDSFNYKRVELTGNLLHNLFKEYYKLQHRDIYLKIDKIIYYQYNKIVEEIVEKNEEKEIDEKEVVELDEEMFDKIITENANEFFKNRIVEKGLRKAFKGNWGAASHTKRLGIVQDLNRLSFNSALSQLRKLNLPLDSSAKVIGPRLLHPSQYGVIDPIDTPDGGSVGLHKHLSLMTHITTNINVRKFIDWLFFNFKKYIIDYHNENLSYIASLVKVFINGQWIGCTDVPLEFTKYLRLLRRNGCLPWSISIGYHNLKNTIYIFCDEGRLMRPLIHVENNKSFLEKNKDLYKKIESNDFSWNQLIYGLKNLKEEKNIQCFDNDYDFNPEEFDFDFEKLIKKYYSNSGIIDFLDTNESETAMIASDETYLFEENNNQTKYTHMEIHPSLLFGVMGNQVIYVENNPSTRNLFSCGQSKQAVSLYHSNYQNRFDKTGIVLNYGQVPLIKCRYLEYIQREAHPYGENVIVAIACYSGYNVEDAILINKGAVDRGLFRTTYYSTVESREESSTVADSNTDSEFMKIIDNKNIIGKKPGIKYQYIGENGLIKEGTKLNDKIALIGKVNKTPDTDNLVDSSLTPKKGQKGTVDKTYLSEDDEGFRIAKIRIREERIPAIGDKMASRAGQKGTIGLVIPQEDMPFTENGIVPDLIINPHALPSRMTIGQIIETLLGKLCLEIGGFGDCTPYISKGNKSKIYGEILKEYGYHSSGNEILYNGFSGEQLKSEIFIGPTYYMRLKHMVKDKINYRAQGPRQQLTRQTVQGRANDGGLRIGEMERDGVIAHGASHFLNDSFMVRGDEYQMAICNNSGTIAVYNSEKKTFYSLHSDGPLKFKDNEDSVVLDTISHHGKDFSIVRVPYTMKLLIHELQAMNIQMRIITEDNIDQVKSMSFTNNIQNKIAYQYIHDMRDDIYKKTNIKDTPVEIKYESLEPFSPNDTPPELLQEGGPVTPPDTPPGTPPDTPPDNSPPWAPDGELNNQNQKSAPDYNELKNQSPPYAPTLGRAYTQEEWDKVLEDMKIKKEIKENNNSISINTVPWAPNSINVDVKEEEPKPVVVFKNEDGSLSKAVLESKENVLNSVKNSESILDVAKEKSVENSEDEKKEEKKETKSINM